MADQPNPQAAAPKAVPIVDNDGNWGTIAPEEANTAVQEHGFRIPSPQEVSDHALESQYGTGIANEVETAAEEAGSVATFGLSRQLENASGITTPQAQAARARFNPGSRLAGAAIPIAATLGAGAPEAGAEAGLEALNPISAVTHGAEGAAQALIPSLGESAGAQAATGALRGATSGALAGGAFGAGNAISEDALGDPDALGEHLLQNVGIGALWGGVPGGILGAISSRFRRPHQRRPMPSATPSKASGPLPLKLGPSGRRLPGLPQWSAERHRPRLNTPLQIRRAR